MKKSVFSFMFLSGLIVATSADANWQYPGRYTRDSWAGDDGMRFVISVRGGASYGRAKIKNEIGGLTGQYMRDDSTGEIVTYAWWMASGKPTGYSDAGYGRLGDLPAAEKYGEVAFTAGFSLGLTMPDAPQWRIEFGFDHIAESDYNQNPLFDGTLTLQPTGYAVDAQSGGVQSTLSSDIYGVMAFYDFFDGMHKPVRQFVPYVGVGAGYANTKTVLQLTDSYGDLSYSYELQNYGIVDESGVIQFNKAETDTSNLVPMLAIGGSYGVNERLFLDVGLRGMYMQKVKWQLTNAETDADAEKRRDWFSAEKMMYVNATVGLRVEF